MGQGQNDHEEVEQLWQEWTEHHQPDTKTALIEHYLPLIEFLSSLKAHAAEPRIETPGLRAV